MPSWALTLCLTQGWKVLTKPTGVPLGGMQRTGFLPTLPQPGNHGNRGELLEAPSHLLGGPGGDPWYSHMGPWVAAFADSRRGGSGCSPKQSPKALKTKRAPVQGERAQLRGPFPNPLRGREDTCSQVQAEPLVSRAAPKPQAFEVLRGFISFITVGLGSLGSSSQQSSGKSLQASYSLMHVVQPVCLEERETGARGGITLAGSLGPPCSSLTASLCSPPEQPSPTSCRSL